ncbi:MarR family winged helix-turn-helix transcriptional regulator [Asticcacaulis machinosus]|uniref:MarR family winged helix-turn-helix transcriptional regulator n=1 Tax=Asticcacaulis machinosus TaxID=2984211 RepID=A0ABT5HJ62_9CAUL|nr:MarR family winged helix-turn-helix transcriptional regulator [Asticcacaulis machinosus]MDC7676180.1 MarR family winged helix-turn-helix transcriptional regulator [Asticcacaulis machinosus]
MSNVSFPGAQTIPGTKATLGSLLRRPYEYLQAKVYGELSARGFPDIRPAHSSLLRYIRPEGSRVVDLAERAQITKQSMAYLVGDLEGLGYVTVVPDPDDGRAKRVMLTTRGQAVWTTLIELSLAAEVNCAELIGADDMATLRRILQNLSQALETQGSGAS